MEYYMNNKTKILILNGWAFHNSIWDKIISSMDYSIDFVNWENTNNVNDYYNLVENKIKTIDNDVILLAWSLGTLVSLGLSNESRKKIKKYIFIGATSKFTRDKDYKIGWSKSVIEKMKKNINTNKSEVLRNFTKNMFSKNEKKFYNDVEKYMLDSDDNISLINGLNFLRDIDNRENLKNLNSEILFIHGSNDRICSIESAIYMYNNVTCKKTLEIIGESGHIPFYTKTKEVFNVIEKFLLRC
jgi:pimeloyl-[acyl-carrier protein] methyl ester esterase